MRHARNATVMGVDHHGLDAVADVLLAGDDRLDRPRGLRHFDHPRLEFLRSHRAAIQRSTGGITALDGLRPDAEFSRDAFGLPGEIAGRLAALLAAEGRGLAGRFAERRKL